MGIRLQQIPGDSFNDAIHENLDGVGLEPLAGVLGTLL
jgi:hypothetical protein